MKLLKKELTIQKRKIIVECYKATEEKKEKKEVFIIFRKRLKKLVHPAMLPFAYATLSKFMSFKKGDKVQDNLEDEIYRTFDKGGKAVNYILRKTEETKKDEAIKTSIQENRKEGKYFYVSSWHGDSALDHKDYQGKVYADEKHPEELDEFIREHHINTIQWVMGEPVYFITRPNCRHFFQEKSTKAILEGRYRIPKSKEGRRAFQTPKGRLTQARLNEYKERLKLLEELYKIKKTAKLRDMILKTKMLIQEWEKRLQAQNLA